MSSPNAARTDAAPLARAWKRWVLAAVLVAAAIVAFRFLPVADAMGWIRARGSLGPAIFVLAYVVACIAFVPGSLLTLGAGAVFGPVVGSVCASLGATTGAAAAFLLGRFVARDAVARRIQGNPRFRAVDDAIAAGGWKIVVLLRLSPLFPFVFLNYALGLTRVRFRDYVVASWIGMLPGTVLYVYLGSVLGEAFLRGDAARPARTTAEWILYAVGLAATIAVALVVTRLARRALAERIK